METVGQILKAARIEKNLTLDDVEKATSIRIKYIEAIENDDYVHTPGDVFVKGIIRTYGNFLELDGIALVDMYKANKIGKDTEAVKSEGIREVNSVKLNISLKSKRNIGDGVETSFIKRIPFKGLVICACCLAIAGAIYYAIPIVNNMFTSEKAVVAETPVPVPVATVKHDKVIIEMQATDKCWLEVKADGKEIFVGMINAQENKKFEAKDKLIVKYGNIGAMKIKLNGEPLDTKGEKGVAVKTYTK